MVVGGGGWGGVLENFVAASLHKTDEARSRAAILGLL